MLTTDKTMLFCIGAQKAGTSWLHTLLATHSECHLPSKEVHYFDTVVDSKRAEGVLKRRQVKMNRVLARAASEKGTKIGESGIKAMGDRIALLENSINNIGDDSAYLAFLLDGAGDKPVIGDITPAYAVLSHREFARMEALSPNSRFLFLLRDPIDRLWSDIRMRAEVTLKRQGGNKAKEDENEFVRICLHRLDSLIEGGPETGPHRSNYLLTIAELEMAVPQEQILNLFFENMFDQASINTICAFIGVAPMAAPVETVKFPGRKLAFPPDRFAKVYGWLKGQYDGMAAKYGDALPQRWRDRMKEGQANG